jgi:alcohol dehydrogenase (cytochrome c)
MSPTEAGNLVYPGVQGGTNWFSPSFSPRTNLFYVIGWENYWTIYYKENSPYVSGQKYQGGTVKYIVAPSRRAEPDVRPADTGYGVVCALDPHTGSPAWEFKLKDVSEGGLLSTASDLLFAGTREGHFLALDARSGALLWRKYLGGQIAASPMSYAADGKQYVAVISGNSIFNFGLREP